MGLRSPSGSSVAAGRRLESRLARLRGAVTVDRLLLAAVVGLWIALYVEGLGDFPLRVWDESRYAVPARRMAEGGSWLEPRIRLDTHEPGLAVEPRLVKPPLTYWLQAGAMVLLGVSEFAARLPSAIAALGCAGLVYRIGARTYGRRAGFAGAVVLLVFPGLLLGSHGGRAAVTDPLLALAGSGFVWLTWRGRERPRLLVPAGICAGLAVMTKGVAAGVFVVAVAPVLVHSFRAYRTPWTVAAVAATAVVALPWHLYAWLVHGEEFVHQYFLTAAASRASGEMAPPPAEPLFGFMNYPYFRFALEMFGPPYPYALPVFGAGLVCAVALLGQRVRRDGPAPHADGLFLCWWAAAVPLTFAVAGGNHPWYLLPMYVPGAVLASSVPAALAPRVESLDLSVELSSGAGTAVYAAVCLCLALLLVGVYAPAPAEAHDAEQRELGEAIDVEVPEDEPVYVHTDTDRRALMSLVFYGDRPLEEASSTALEGDPAVRYAIVPVENRQQLDRDHRVLAEGPVNGVAVVEFVGDRG
ncbi:ArnT family glycosyltransferase [Saliphagus infecundisoli]|uniref:ArnT family glycosyltransferase n=1 Tax=Saliphagus infecundisoli TaxID=1849069 RepID=A0ABD5QJ33_9EURY|nr:glycosyltransferase family 39 protein [Saliphagus infecundisoli]